MKIALCFWGIMRSTKFTHQNIKNKIYTPLQEMGHTYRVYIHTYEIKGRYTNKRAQETLSEINANDAHLLCPDVFQIDCQDEFDNTHDIKDYLTKGDPWNNGGASLQNVLRYLNSQKRVFELVNKDTENEFDIVILLRPDVHYIDVISQEIMDKCAKLHSNEILIPNFHHFKGLNDRMAIGGLNVISLYANRLDKALDYSKEKWLHSESFLKDVLVGEKIKWKWIDYKFKRVRCDGRIVDKDV